MTKSKQNYNKFFNNSELFIFLFLIIFTITSTLTFDKVKTSSIKEQQTLSKKEISEDIDVLVEYLNNTYAGQYIFPTEYKQLIESLNSYKNNYDKPLKISRIQKDLNWLRQNFPDGHLKFNLKKTESFRQQVSMNTRFLSYEFKNIKSLKVLTLKIPSFLITEESEFKDLLKVLQQNLMTLDYLVLDLTGNGGGYTTYATQLAAVIWNSKYAQKTVIQPFPTPYKRELQLTSDYSYKLFENYDKKYGLNEFNFFSDKKTNQLKTTHQSPKKSEILNTDFDFKKPIKFAVPSRPKNIFLIADYNCASACERLIEMLEFHPRLIKLGSSTAGSTQLGNIGLLTLPNSELSVAISTRAIEYFDNRRIEQIGYKPNLQVTAVQEDYLPTVYLYIEKNFK